MVGGLSARGAVKYSDDGIFSSGPVWRFEGGVSHTMGPITAYASAGREEGALAYWDWRAGAAWSMEKIEVRAYWSDTVGLSGPLAENAGGRIVAEIAVRF